jgi:outer membrane receptor protein involved in Fe transport
LFYKKDKNRKKHYRLTKLAALVTRADLVLAQDSQSSLTLEEIVVTAQKRSESLQDVPIAVSAFTQDALEDQGIVSGPDLKIAVPNVAFNDLGFGRFNFQIRGVGAFLIGPSADTGVGIHQNNIPLQQNRLPTAEFYDVERVEVLRGPQGTLYGRNSTGGVVNVLSVKPDDEFSAEATGELGNFNSKRLKGYVNLPAGDQLAFRVAGTMIDRDGTIENTGTGNDVDSRDIWSTRATVRWQPTDSFQATAMWETFRQDDSSGANQKTLCAVNSGPEFVGAQATDAISRALLTDSCADTHVTDSRNYGVSNSLGTLPGILAYYTGANSGNYFEGATVDRDLRTIDKAVDPFLDVENDLFSLELALDINDGLSLTAVTAYAEDDMQLSNTDWGATPTVGFNTANPLISDEGIYVDPNLGATDVALNRFYLARETEQISQELRLQSTFDGSVNFNLGALYMQ